MKATKKIVGAACALVAAVALSAGSTFAWFASNNKVTADGMKVQATVPTNLYIAKNYLTSVDGVNETSITYEDDTATSLSPSAISNAVPTETATTPATGNLTDGKFYVLNALKYSTDPASGNAGVASEYSTVDTLTATSSEVTSADANNAWKTYLYKQDMTLANKSNDVDVSATVTLSFPYNTDANSYKFIRVGFVIGDGTTYTLTSSVNNVGNTGASGVTYTAGSAATETDPAKASTLVFEYNKLIANFEGNTLKTVSFLVWFDGDDVDCFVNNALEVSEFDISILYTATGVTVSGGEAGNG